ncbi:hypothetical protein EDD22DRAFT_295657 [Suillus occidentalis]|nr:hypothetical protein EDD22DRAFT_295657 [Suillus occidentalis]
MTPGLSVVLALARRPQVLAISGRASRRDKINIVPGNTVWDVPWTVRVISSASSYAMQGSDDSVACEKYQTERDDETGENARARSSP